MSVRHERDRTLYDTIGSGYTATRRPDGRHEATIRTALGDAWSVLDVGAGAGSYEPRDRRVVAVEPSAVMIAQRPDDAAPSAQVQAVAERLPFLDDAFDAAMAVLTVHHWEDPRAGLFEVRRVTRGRVVVVTADVDVWARCWLVRDYFPEIVELDRGRFASPELVADALGGGVVEPLLTPHDCTDGFTPAYWRRPEAYLDPRVRAGSSSFAQLGEAAVAEGLRRLERDVGSGAWSERNAELLDLEAFDAGHRLVIAG